MTTDFNLGAAADAAKAAAAAAVDSAADTVPAIGELRKFIPGAAADAAIGEEAEAGDAGRGGGAWGDDNIVEPSGRTHNDES